MSEKRKLNLSCYFGHPVAVQLRAPFVVVDNEGKTVDVGTDDEWGLPEPVFAGGESAATIVLCGVIKPASDLGEGLYFLEAMTDHKARVRYLLDPELILTIADVLQPGLGPSNIVAPGAN